MPTPRLKRIILKANDKMLIAFYAGRNAAGMKQDAHTQFFAVFGQNVIDGGVEGYEYAEKNYNGSQMLFHDEVRSYSKEYDVEYTPKVSGIGERWTVKPLQDEAETVFGKNDSGDGIPPSLDPFDNFVEEIVEEVQTTRPRITGEEAEEIQRIGAETAAEGAGKNLRQENLVFRRLNERAGAAAAPAPLPDTEPDLTPPTIEPPADPQPEESESNRQKHEIIHRESGQRITFETEGDPDWGGQEIPEGYRRIDEEAEIVYEEEDRAAKVETIPDHDYPDSPAYDVNDIIVHEQSSRPVSAVHGLPYDELDYAKGDARYIAEDGKLGRPQEFGPSEYERALNNIRTIPLEDFQAAGDDNGETAEQKKERLRQDYEKIDTGKLRNPDNMRREAEMMREEPAAPERKEENGKKASGVRIVVETPKPGRRSNSLFGVQR